MINDGFADIVEAHRDQFPGFVAQVSIASPDGAVKEAKRAINDLGACGVQIYTNVNGKPLDQYFARPVLRMILSQPLVVVNRITQFDLTVTVTGAVVATTPLALVALAVTVCTPEGTLVQLKV